MLNYLPLLSASGWELNIADDFKLFEWRYEEPVVSTLDFVYDETTLQLHVLNSGTNQRRRLLSSTPENGKMKMAKDKLPKILVKLPNTPKLSELLPTHR